MFYSWIWISCESWTRRSFSDCAIWNNWDRRISCFSGLRIIDSNIPSVRRFFPVRFTRSWFELFASENRSFAFGHAIIAAFASQSAVATGSQWTRLSMRKIGRTLSWSGYRFWFFFWIFHWSLVLLPGHGPFSHVFDSEFIPRARYVMNQFQVWLFWV